MVPRISEAEWRIMNLLWKKSPQTSGEIIESLKDEVDWAPKTVKTLLNRLLGKKVLGYKKSGRSYLYFPKLSEAACKREAAHSFINRVFDGALKPMVATFIEEGRLSRKDIEDLKQILEDQGESDV
jgi:BlaI family penicillinase repressor